MFKFPEIKAEENKALKQVADEYERHTGKQIRILQVIKKIYIK